MNFNQAIKKNRCSAVLFLIFTYYAFESDSSVKSIVADYFGISEFYRRQFFAVAERSVAYNQVTDPRIMFKHGSFGTGKRSVGYQATLAQPQS